jgi:hypothetical protein
VSSPEGAWGSCPECDAAITETMAFCKACGFPLKPVQKTSAAAPPAPAPAMRTGKRRRRGKGGAMLEPGEEAPTVTILAVLGLIIPVLAFIALAQSRRGSAAYIMSWVGIGLWVLSFAALIATRMHG